MNNFEIAFVAIFTHPFPLGCLIGIIIALTVLHFREPR